MVYHNPQPWEILQHYDGRLWKHSFDEQVMPYHVNQTIRRNQQCQFWFLGQWLTSQCEMYRLRREQRQWSLVNRSMATKRVMLCSEVYFIQSLSLNPVIQIWSAKGPIQRRISTSVSGYKVLTCSKIRQILICYNSIKICIYYREDECQPGSQRILKCTY